jgi:hypothetical protein
VDFTAMVSRDFSAPIGSTLTPTSARIGPSVPRTDHLCGTSASTTSEVLARSANPIRRTVTHRAPPFSMRPLTTPFCHSAKRDESVAYVQTRPPAVHVGADGDRRHLSRLW